MVIVRFISDWLWRRSNSQAHQRLFQTEQIPSDLGRRTVRGGAATITAQVAKFLLQLLSTAVLARLLAPSDFGLVAMVAAFTGFISLFKDLGLSMATVQRPEINHEQVTALFWINVALSMLLMLIAALAAPVVAWFYGEPRLTGITVAVAVTFVFAGLTAQHTALLRRQMRFSALAGIEVISMLAGICGAIAMAWAGWGYWSLIGMSAASSFSNMLCVWRISPWRPGPPQRNVTIGPMLRFGGHLTVFNAINYLGRNVDNLLIGVWWGAGPVGLYAKAYSLLLLPIRQVTHPVAAVVVPALCRLQDRPEQYRKAYTQTINAIAHASMPLIALAGAMADEIVLLVLGPQWAGAGPVFRMLAFAALLQPVLNTVGWVCTSTGTTDRMMRASFVGVPLFIMSFIIGLPWGTVGVAGAYAVAVNMWFVPAFVYLLRGSGLRLADIIHAIKRPLGLAACVYIVVNICSAIELQLTPVLRSAIAAAAALVVWFLLLVVWHSARQELMKLVLLIRTLGGTGVASSRVLQSTSAALC